MIKFNEFGRVWLSVDVELFGTSKFVVEFTANVRSVMISIFWNSSSFVWAESK